MNKKVLGAVFGILGATTASADNLFGANQLLCAPRNVTHCSSGGDCESGPPDDFNIPNFIRIDLERELLLTTEASGDSLSTPIQHFTRVDGAIYLQGMENGRAYSMVIVEATGNLSVAVASDGETATTFGTCTPD